MPQVIKCIEFREVSISIEQAGNLLDVGSVGGQSLERFASHHDPKDSQAGKRPKDRSLVSLDSSYRGMQNPCRRCRVKPEHEV